MGEVYYSFVIKGNVDVALPPPPPHTNQYEMHNYYILHSTLRKEPITLITISTYNVPAPMVKTLSKSAQSAICL